MDCPQIDARETAEKTETSDLFRESRPKTPSSIQPVGLHWPPSLIDIHLQRVHECKVDGHNPADAQMSSVSDDSVIASKVAASLHANPPCTVLLTEPVH